MKDKLITEEQIQARVAELAQQIGFPEKNFGEDSDYCDRLLESGLLKNEVILDKVMYHYLCNSELTRTH